MKKIRDEAVLQVRMTAEQSQRARKGRSSEAVRRKSLRAAVAELVRATHVVHLVHTAGHHQVGKFTRNLVANLRIKSGVRKCCLTLQQNSIMRQQSKPFIDKCFSLVRLRMVLRILCTLLKFISLISA